MFVIITQSLTESREVIQTLACVLMSLLHMLELDSYSGLLWSSQVLIPQTLSVWHLMGIVLGTGNTVMTNTAPAFKEHGEIDV